MKAANLKGVPQWSNLSIAEGKLTLHVRGADKLRGIQEQRLSGQMQRRHAPSIARI